MTAEHLKSLILTFIATFIFVVVGRLVMAMSGSQNTIQNSPLHIWITGAGLAYMAFIFMADFVSLQMLWWGLFVLALLGVFVFFRIASRARIEQHSLAQVLFSFLVLLPSFFYVSVDVPMQAEEYTSLLKPLEDFFATGGVGQGFSALFLPQVSASLMGMQWVVATPALLNVVVLAFTGMTLVRMVGVRVRWSNMLLAAAFALLSLFVFNPFIDLSDWLSVRVELLAAAAMLVVVSPFCTDHKFPYGFSLLPQAFALSFLVGTYPKALILAIFIVLLYAYRLIFVEKRWRLGDLFALLLLTSLPLISYYMQASLAQTPWPWLIDEAREFPSVSIILATLLCSLISLSAWVVMKAWRSPFKKYGYITVPLVLVLFLALSGLSVPWEILQFVLLIPAWKLYLMWYAKSDVKSLAYASPWGAGLVVMALFWGLQGYVLGRYEQGYTAQMNHVLNVSAGWNESLLEESRIAVLDGRTGGYYSHLMNYKFGGLVQDETRLYWSYQGKLTPYFSDLKKNGYTHLWIHSADDVMRENINKSLRGDHSYLFKIDGNRLSLVKGGIYPHLSYTLSGGRRSEYSHQ